MTEAGVGFQARVAAAKSFRAVRCRVAAHLRPEQNRSSALLGMLPVWLLALRMLKFSTDSLVSCCKRPCSRIGMASPCRQASISAVCFSKSEGKTILLSTADGLPQGAAAPHSVQKVESMLHYSHCWHGKTGAQLGV